MTMDIMPPKVASYPNYTCITLYREISNKINFPGIEINSCSIQVVNTPCVGLLNLLGNRHDLTIKPLTLKFQQLKGYLDYTMHVPNTLHSFAKLIYNQQLAA